MYDFAHKGEDVFIGKYTDLTQPLNIKIGNHSAIDSFVSCTTTLLVGDYVHISPHVSIVGGVQSCLKIEDFCFIAAGSRIICGSEDFCSDGLTGPRIPLHLKKKMRLTSVHFKRFSGVGANTVVLPGITLAEGSVIGANSLVTKDTLPWGLYAGSPAKFIRFVPKEKTIAAAKELGYDYV
jgi:galactoside O-acetyltransferase